MAPSMLGKLKTSDAVRRDRSGDSCASGDPIGGLYVDEWAMLAAAAITVWSAVDYLVRAIPKLTADTHR